MRLALLLATAALWAAGQEAPQTETPLRVLFLGNSYTYYNDLPAMLATLAKASGGRPIEAKGVTRGGANLAEVWSLTSGLEEVRAGGWDYVVLQEQSTLGQSYVDGRWGVNDPAGFWRWARFWQTEILRSGAKPVLYLTWGRKLYPEFQTGLDYAYSEAARQLEATLAPVGLAWKRVRETAPDVELFDADGTHPSPTGTYLTACVFLEVFNGRTCEGPQAVLPVLRLTEETQQVLAAAAHWAVTQERAGLLRDLPRPDYGTARTLPTPQNVKPEDYQGRWKGKARIYNAEHEMELQLTVKEKFCAGRLTLMNRKNGFEITLPLSRCGIDFGTLLFTTTDPRLVIEDFRAVLDNGLLIGNHSLRDVDPYRRILGSFELKKD